VAGRTTARPPEDQSADPRAARQPPTPRAPPADPADSTRTR